MASSSDPRTRGTFKLDSIYEGAHALGRNRIPVDLLLGLLLTKTVLASAALLARHWLLTNHSEAAHGVNTSSDGGLLLSHGVSAWAITTLALSIGAVVQAVWFRIWEWAAVVKRMDPHLAKLPQRIGILGALVFVHTLLWIMTLSHIPATNVLIFTQYCDVWAADMVRSNASRKSAGYSILIAILISFLASVASGPSDITSSFLSRHSSSAFPPDFDYDDELDMPKSLRGARPAGLAPPSYLRAASAIHEQREKGILPAGASSPLGVLVGHALLVLYALLTIEKERAMVVASRETGGRRRAMVLATVAAAAITVPFGILGSLVGLPTFPSLSSLTPSLNPANAVGSHLAAYVLIALGVVVLDPLMATTLQTHASVKTGVQHGWPMAVLACMLVGFVGFGVPTSLATICAGGFVGWGLNNILTYSPEFNGGTSFQRTHSHRDSDLRGIFQFLCLNLAFMGVQLAWGVWTNSLGLISDAIHMFFDCAAIGMGLFASVMANWKTDGTFTMGYSRVETLSGFANGVFLILISVFIVFEAVQRIIEPPVMHNTTQLLVVSGMGLLVN
ncbi:unnamed protein product, partial [Tilletia controversa]